MVDLDGVDIGQSFKISSIKLPENVHPTIRGRDFVVATLAAPTVIKEPEKPAETVEGAEGTEEGAAPTEGAEEESKAASPEGEKGDKKEETKKRDEKKPPAEKK
jgi:large subunit ribosomal protein L25